METTKNELLNILNQIEKPTFVRVKMNTEVRMRKTDNPYFGLVKKVTSGNYLIGTDYKSRVEGNGQKEGMDFEYNVEPPKGKRHVSKCVLIDTKTESVHYLMMERFDEIKPQVHFVMNGEDIEKGLFEHFMNKVYTSTKQTQERKVTPITPKVDNILEMTIDKVKYEIIHENVPIEV